MDLYSKKHSDVLIVEFAGFTASEILLTDFISKLKNISDKLINEYNCYPNSLILDLSDFDEYSYFVPIKIKGYRPETKIEKEKRLNKIKTAKEKSKKMKQIAKDGKYQKYLQLKKEFEK